jgi:hypothetical protein
MKWGGGGNMRSRKREMRNAINGGGGKEASFS